MKITCFGAMASSETQHQLGPLERLSVEATQNILGDVSLYPCSVGVSSAAGALGMLEIIASCHLERFVPVVSLQQESQGQLGFSLFREVSQRKTDSSETAPRDQELSSERPEPACASHLISLIPGLTCMCSWEVLGCTLQVREGSPRCLLACVGVQCGHGRNSTQQEGDTCPSSKLSPASALPLGASFGLPVHFWLCSVFHLRRRNAASLRRVPLS